MANSCPFPSSLFALADHTSDNTVDQLLSALSDDLGTKICPWQEHSALAVIPETIEDSGFSRKKSGTGSKSRPRWFEAPGYTADDDAGAHLGAFSMM